jgi:uncharacterized small protein (DUF1192 family)
MPDKWDGGDKWEYSDELALLTKRVEALEQQIAALIADLAHVKAGQERQAKYQGVTHLLSPQ